jgi:hypothetical protein
MVAKFSLFLGPEEVEGPNGVVLIQTRKTTMEFLMMSPWGRNLMNRTTGF